MKVYVQSSEDSRKDVDVRPLLRTRQELVHSLVIKVICVAAVSEGPAPPSQLLALVQPDGPSWHLAAQD